MEFSEKLKKLRNEKGVSQQELADKIYVSRSAVAKWENGLGLPCKESLQLLCEFFGVNEASLFGEDEDQNVRKNRKIFKYKKLLIASCAVLCVLIGLGITALALYFNGALPAKVTLPASYPSNFPTIAVEGIEAPDYIKMTKTTENGAAASSAPVGEDAAVLPLLPYKNVYSVSLPDDAILDQPSYYFLNDDYSPISLEDASALSAEPILPVTTAPLWYKTEVFRCAGVDSEKSEVSMDFRKNRYNVIVVKFLYTWQGFTAVAYYRVER